MMEYILKVKSITDDLASIGEPVKERDQILQILGGLRPEYNSVVSYLTSRDEDLSLHSVHSIWYKLFMFREPVKSLKIGFLILVQLITFPRITPAFPMFIRI